jgi:hypothetical protein
LGELKTPKRHFENMTKNSMFGRRKNDRTYLPSRPACFGKVPKMNQHAVTLTK